MSFEERYINGELVQRIHHGASESFITYDSRYIPLPPVARAPIPKPPAARGPIPLPPRAIPLPPGAIPLPPACIPLPPAEVVRERVAMDIECYKDYFLVKFTRAADRQVIAEFEMFPPMPDESGAMVPGQPLDIAGITRLAKTVCMVTFNGWHYDIPMLSAALQGYDYSQLKFLSDTIIGPPGQQGKKPWEIEREFKIYAPDYLDHIDLKEILPGQYSLKMYMAKMQSPIIQELPIEPSASITPGMRPLMRKYCGNDNNGVIDALNKFKKEIALRERMSKTYGIDLRSKSDAQIAEAVIKHELGFYVERPVWAAGTYFHFDPPAYIQYRTPVLQSLLETVRNAKFWVGLNAVELPVELDAEKTESANIRIGHSVYTIGLGGLHSQEKSTFHYSDADYVLQDVDVRSYYPEMMLNSGLYPPQMGPAFRAVFKSLVDQRLAAKDAGDKSTADSLKITINGTFGKTLSKYGVLSAPKFGVQTTVGGQLSILMLIEALELNGIAVVSANTDGIVIKCPRNRIAIRDQVVAEWERVTTLKTEASDYLALYSMAVNDYIAIKAPTEENPKPEIKCKGEFASYKVAVGGSWPSPTGYICVTAVVDFLMHGTPLEKTIRECTDVREFVFVRNVKGGGVKFYGHQRESVATKGGMRQALTEAGWSEIDKETFYSPMHNGGALPMKEAYKIALEQLRAADGIKREYIGKVVRWYHAKNCPGAIHYETNGNRVPDTEGAKPLMILPDAVPADIDYEWYIVRSVNMLRNIGLYK